ncbi:MAG TPA: tRNA (adenosine(37)-N6)-dimethylallyltransferase MiaA [Verrucomicrobiae bacterium]|nr:tRNA (adenosine(37)-N6)-dimethylallyltransferase MiaA [Verrucomicrobiae bacterium]
MLFLVGPTAAGKSKIALLVARRLGGEIISADSMQVYRGMDIGTAKPSAAERKEIPHHLIDLVEPSESFSVYEFRRRALAAIQDIVSRKKLPIVAGGTGLYVRSLLEGLSPQPGGDALFREKMEQTVSSEGIERLYKDLKKCDPESAARIKPTDKRRIIRALEIRAVSGKSAGEWYASKEGLTDLGFEPLVLGITRERSFLYREIEKRVDEMFEKGLVREVRLLARQELSKTAFQAVGYKELLLSGPELSGREADAAKDLIKKNTRHLAKRQMTWFRKEKNIQWLTWEPEEKLKDFVDRIICIVR